MLPLYERISDTVVERLQAGVLLAEPLAVQKAPCDRPTTGVSIVVQTENEITVEAPIGYRAVSFILSLNIVNFGSDPRMAVATADAQAHAALYADRSLGGLALDITRGDVEFMDETGNDNGFGVRVDYHVFYRHTEADITV